MALNNNNNNNDDVFEVEEGSGYESDITLPTGFRGCRYYANALNSSTFDARTQRDKRVFIRPNLLRDDNQVDRIATLLRANNWNNIVLEFETHSQGFPPTNLNLGPLINELTTREHLAKVQIHASPGRPFIFLPFSVVLRDSVTRALPHSIALHALLHRPIFEAFQHNANLRSLVLKRMVFADPEASAIAASFLDDTPQLRELELNECTDSSEEHQIATALSRNPSLQVLRLKKCGDGFVIPILQLLASPTSTSQLTKLVYENSAGMLSEPVAAALEQYKQSAAGATVQCLELARLKKVQENLQRLVRIVSAVPYLHLRNCGDSVVIAIFQQLAASTQPLPLKKFATRQILLNRRHSQSW